MHRGAGRANSVHKAVGKAGYAGQFVSTQGCPEGRCKCLSTCVCVCAPLATRHLWLWLQELGLVRQRAWTVHSRISDEHMEVGLSMHRVGWCPMDAVRVNDLLVRASRLAREHRSTPLTVQRRSAARSSLCNEHVLVIFRGTHARLHRDHCCR